MNLDETYHDLAVMWSDVQGHLDTFVRIGLTADKVIELGTRGGASTIAWLYGLEGHGHLWSVDIDPPPELDADHWTFVRGDDRDPSVLAQLPDQVDAVFIDTSHAYQHTLGELALYLPKVRPGGVILLHDTELEYPDFIGPSMPFPVRRAVEVFCHERDLAWSNVTHDYGLATIEVPL